MATSNKTKVENLHIDGTFAEHNPKLKPWEVRIWWGRYTNGIATVHLKVGNLTFEQVFQFLKANVEMKAGGKLTGNPHRVEFGNDAWRRFVKQAQA